MIFTIDEFDGDVGHGVTGHWAAFHTADDAFFDGGNELARNGAADDLIDEFEPFAARQRVGIDVTDAELTGTARLFLVLTFDAIDAFFNRFAIGDERQRNVDFEFEFSFEFFDRHIEVLLPHAAQCECASEFVVARRKRRIFVDEFVDGDFELVFFALCLRRHIEIHHGSGVLDRLEREIDAATQRIVCARIFEFGDADDIAEDAFFDGIAVATAQDVERSEAFAVARAPKPTTN